jgi:hypothetical protein
MGWFSASVNTNYEKRSENESGYGTRTPNVSDEYKSAFADYRGSLNSNGFNNTQQGAVNYANNYLNNGGAAARVAPVNTDLTNIRTNLDRYAAGTPNLLNPNAPRANTAQSSTVQATAGQASNVQSNVSLAEAAQGEAFDSANVDPITGMMISARQGSEFMDSYKNPYLRDVVDASLADYDQGAAEGYNALRASSAGAFGNKRTGVAEGQFMGGASRGRGALSAGLRSDAFNTAAGYGMQDVNRFLASDQSNQATDLQAKTTNADNLLRNNQFNAGNRTNVSLTNAGMRTNVNQTNAGLTTQNNQFNAGQTNETNRFNTGQANTTNMFNTGQTNTNNQFNTGQTNENNRFNTGIENTRDLADLDSRNTADARAITALATQAGITNDIAANIFKADGIDLDVANNLFTAGTISQSQLDTIIAAARDFNGSSYTDNRNRSGSTFGIGTEVGF